MFTLIPGEMIQFDGCIFFSWVGEKPPVLGIVIQLWGWKFNFGGGKLDGPLVWWRLCQVWLVANVTSKNPWKMEKVPLPTTNIFDH